MINKRIEEMVDKEMVNEEMRDLLQQIADLAYQASEEVYDDDKEEGTAGILCLCDQLYEKIDNYLARYKEKITKETITKETIKTGLNSGFIYINTDDEYGCMGLHCRIGGNGFYFGGNIDISNMTMDEFNKAFSQDEVVDMLYECLRSENAAEENGLGEDEYELYRIILEDMYDYEMEKQQMVKSEANEEIEREE